MDPPIDSSPPLARPAGPIIDFDVPCFVCRYNLRTLSRESNCPECNTPVLRTFEGGWLQFADPAWLRRVRSGVGLLLWGTLLILLGVLSIPFLVAFNLEPTEVWRIGLGFGLFGGLFWSLWLTGLLRSTGIDPLEPHSSRSRRTGLVIILLAAAILACLAYALALFMLVLGERGWEFSLFSLPLYTVALGTYLLAVWLTTFLFAFHIRRLARREPREGLRKLLTFFLWLSGLITASFGLMAGLFLFSGRVMSPRPTVFVTSVTPAGTSTTSFSYGPAAQSSSSVQAGYPYRVISSYTVVGGSAPAAPPALLARMPNLILMGIVCNVSPIVWIILWLVLLVRLRRILGLAARCPR